MTEIKEISKDLQKNINNANNIKTTNALLEFIKPTWISKYGWISNCDIPFFEDYIVPKEDICKLIKKRKGIKENNYIKELRKNKDLEILWTDENKNYKGKDKEKKYPNRAKLFTDLFPVQIMGNIETAEIYLLNMNPSMSEKNIDEEIILNQYKEHIDQYKDDSNLEKSLYFIKSDYKDTGGYKWWRSNSHFGEWITFLHEEYQLDEKRAINVLSKQFCSIEAVPYHARYLTYKINNNLEKLPSFQAIQNYINKLIIPKCKKNKAIIICLRKLYDYNLDGYNNVFSSPSPLSAHFGPSSKNKRFVEEVKKLLDKQIRHNKQTQKQIYIEK